MGAVDGSPCRTALSAAQTEGAASGKPLVYGDTLRLLLFVRDGWGWNKSIKDLCLRAIDKSIAATIAPVRRYVRGPLDHEKAQFAADAHDIPLTPGERHAVGILVSGEPLEGASLERVFHATDLIGLYRHPSPTGSSSFSIRSGMSRIRRVLPSKMFGSGGFSASVIRTMFSNLSSDDARPGALRFTSFVLPLRRFVHRAALAEGKKGQSTNPLSMFGQTQRELEKSFREGGAPKRITPAQLLAAFVGIQILGDVLFRYMDHIATLAVETAKKVGLKAPDDEQQLLPFAMRLMELTFGTQAVQSVTATPPKYTLGAPGPR